MMAQEVDPMSKKAPLFFLLLTALLALSGLGLYCLADPQPKEDAAMPDVTLIVATDLHYIAPALTDHGAYFEEMIQNSDGKVVEYIDELTDAFLAEVIDRKPDALILSGDISFNGARTSHETLAAKLRAVEDAGIPVLVMPGNHDLENSSAAEFHGDGFTRVESVTEEEFADIYRELGLTRTTARDEASLSYVVDINPSLRILMLDVNTSDSPNRVKEETLAWAEAQLRTAAETGARVIAVSHQNVFRHNSVIYRGYVMENAEELLALYEKYGVLVNLSGHLHCQHIARDDAGFYEIATSSLAVNPCQYGVITLSGNTLAYETKPVDVAAWAAAQGLDDPNLLDFASYARDFFMSSGRTVIDPENPDAAALGRFFAELNAAYFAGRLDLVDGNDPMFDRWTDAFGFEGQYILAIRDEAGLDSTHITLTY